MKTTSIIGLVLATIFSFSFQNTNIQREIEKKAIPNEQEVQNPSAKLFTFEKENTGEVPQKWSPSFSGKEGESPNWKIVDDQGNKVLAQLAENNPDYHFNTIVYDKVNSKNVDLTVRIKGKSGELDQGGGIIWRYTDANNYYVVRANPLEDNVTMYKVENGERTALPLLNRANIYELEVPRIGNDWIELRLLAINNLFTVYLNGIKLFQVRDNTFDSAGKVGLWTKSDAVSYFDNFVLIKNPKKQKPASRSKF